MVARGVVRGVARGVTRGVVAAGGEDLYVNSREELDALLIANGVAEADVVSTWDAIWPVLIDPDTGVAYASAAAADNQIYNQGGILKADIVAAIPVVTYQGEVESNAPIAYWHLDETSGTTLSDSAGSYDLTLTGSYSLNQSTIAGSSASVDFTGGYASRTGGPDLSATDYTIELVINLTAVGSQAAWFGIITYASGSSSHWAMQRAFTSNDLRIYHGSNNVNFTGALTNFVDGSNHHIVLTFTDSSNTLELWIDGVSQGTQVIAGNPTHGASDTLYLAASRDPIACDGVFDEVAIYDKKLSDSAIAGLFTATGL